MREDNWEEEFDREFVVYVNKKNGIQHWIEPKVKELKLFIRQLLEEERERVTQIAEFVQDVMVKEVKSQCADELEEYIKDHYWDSLAHNKDIIALHLDNLIKKWRQHK